MSEQQIASKPSWLETDLTPRMHLTVENVFAILILLAALFTRFYGLGDRVMSHDEINHVVPAFEFSQGVGYRYDPMSHGPLQFHLMAASYFLLGDDDFTSRLPHALFSIATVAAALFLFRRYFGKVGALAAGVLLVISPYMLFYGRYARNEAFIVLWGVLTIYAVLRYLERGSAFDLLVFTLVNAFHFVDKSTAYIFAAEQLLFLGAYFLYRVLRDADVRTRIQIRNLLIFAIGTLFLIAGLIILTVTSEESLVAKIPGLIFGGCGLVATIFAGYSLLTDIGWERVRTERSFDLIVLLGTIVLPLLAALPMHLMGLHPLDSDNWLTALILVAVLGAIAIFVGWWWKQGEWLKLYLSFFFVFILFFSTFGTYLEGIGGGFLGALGYWMEQQGVERGGQPWYYYLFLQIPIYEYLPFLGMLLAACVGFRRRLWQALQDQPFQPLPEEMPGDSTKSSVPTLALIVFWSIANLIAFSYAGEKMPWLTVHIAAPMILCAAWLLGYLIGTPARQTSARVMTWFEQAFLWTGQEIRGAILTLAASASQIARGWVVALFVLLGVLTARTAVQAAFWNYDLPVEYLVYAHAAPAPKWLYEKIEDMSFQYTGTRDLVVAYDNDVRYPYWWYMRHYPNRIDFDVNPTSSVRGVPILLVSDENNQKVQPFLKDHYAKFRYARLWWPNLDYWSLKWEDINGEYRRRMSQEGISDPPEMNVIDYLVIVWDRTVYPFATDENFRSAVFQIWFNRDFTQWGEVMGHGGYSIADWGVANWMNVYIRKDFLAQTGGSGIVHESGGLESDPYLLAQISVFPDLTLGSQGGERGQFQSPRGVAMAGDGTFYVADSFNHRIQRFDADGKFLLEFGSYGEAGAGNAPGGTFLEPWGVAVGPEGSVYVADTWNHRVQKFSAEGKFLTMWGQYGMGESPLHFYGPRAVAVDAEGKVFVADTGNKRIVVFDGDGNYLTQFGSEGANTSQLNEPVGVAIDTEGRVYVADTWNSRIQVFLASPGGDYLSYLSWEVDAWYGNGPDNKPFLAIDTTGKVYVTDPDTCRIMQFDGSGNILAVWGTCGEGESALGAPLGLAVTQDANIWVSDSKNHKLLRFPLPNRLPMDGFLLPIANEETIENPAPDQEIPPAGDLEPQGIGQPISLGDHQFEMLSVRPDADLSGISELATVEKGAMTYGAGGWILQDIPEGDALLLLETRLLAGSPGTFAGLDLLVSSGGSQTGPAAVLAVDDTWIWIFLVPEDADSYLLILPGDVTIDLMPYVKP